VVAVEGERELTGWDRSGRRTCGSSLRSLTVILTRRTIV
jgi:hypothetical protein